MLYLEDSTTRNEPKRILASVPRRRIFLKGILVAVGVILFHASFISSAQGQVSPKPLSKDDVVTLLKGEVSPKRVVTLARERGINFEMSTKTETELHQAGATEELLATLRKLAPKPTPPPPATATLVIVSTPSDAKIFVDDELVGRTGPGGLTISQLAPGPHRLRLSLDGYNDYQQGVELVAGHVTPIRASLESSKPPSAGEEEGRKPAADATESVSSALFTSLNAKVTKVQFFEFGTDPPQSCGRKFRSRFDRLKTRYVYWQMTLKYPKGSSRVDFNVDVTWYHNDSSFANQTVRTQVLPGWRSSCQWGGWGSSDPAHWAVGSYSVVLSVGGRKIAGGSFGVY